MWAFGVTLSIFLIFAGVYLIRSGIKDISKMKERNDQVSVEDAASDKTVHIDYDIQTTDNLYAHYKEISDDVVARLYIPNTTMETAVMSSDYYFRRDMSGEYSTGGVPFFDPEGGEFMKRGQNAVIYGHRLDTAEDFGMLKSYVDQTFYDLHPTLFFETDDGITEWKIVSVFTLNVETDPFDYLGYPDLSSAATRNKFVAEITKRSLVDTGANTFNENTRFVTLSTCHYETHPDNGRLVVVAIYN